MEWLRSAELFVHVVHLGSLSAAARKCGISAATVSRVIQSLEQDVGGRLIDRTSRKLSLTEAGELYYARVEQILVEIQEANETVARLQVSPRGIIRVHSRLHFGNAFVAPALPGFLARYPEVTVDLQLSNYPADLIAQNIDVDIRIGRLEDSSFVVRKLAEARRVLVAAPSYVRGGPPLVRPADLTTHNCLTYRLNLGQPMWRLSDRAGGLHEVHISGNLRSDNPHALMTAALAGTGIALVPEWAVRDDIAAGRLVRLLSDFDASYDEFDNGVYAVFRHSSQIPSKVRAFIDYLAAYVKVNMPDPGRRDLAGQLRVTVD